MNTTSDSPEKPKIIECPVCKTPVAWIEKNRYRPFCSERCQLIDFGDWATEAHAIPVKEGPDNLSFRQDLDEE